MRARPTGAVVAAALTALATAAPALAVEVRMELPNRGPVLAIRADGVVERNDLTVSLLGPDLFGNRNIRVVDAAADDVETGFRCGKDLFNFRVVTCSNPKSEKVQRAFVELGDASDRIVYGLSARVQVNGGKGDDTITAGIGDDFLQGQEGDDTIRGGDGDDQIFPGPGVDEVRAGAGDDFVFARDDRADVIQCGSGDDTVSVDPSDFVSGSCEEVNAGMVGTFRLAPPARVVRAGHTAEVALAWRHPTRWRDLRSVDFRLTADGLPVANLRFDEASSTFTLGGPYPPHRSGPGKPGSARTLTTGPVSLLLGGTRVVGSGPQGKTVTLQLSFRFAATLARRTITIEVGATDDRGRRQPFARAGVIRVLGTR
jgi:hypothetical protein